MKTNRGIETVETGDSGLAVRRRLVSEAHGCIDLGMLDEAEARLRVVADEPDAPGREARAMLAHILLSQRRFEESASLGLGLIEAGAANENVIINAMLALHFLGRIAEAQETLNLLGALGVPPEREAYQKACFAARLGEFPEALRWLLMEFRRSDEYFVHSLEDTDLAPLWEWLKRHEPVLAEAHDIIETPLAAVREVCGSALRDIRYSAGDLDEQPESVPGLLRYDFKNGRYALPPLRAVRHPEEVEALLSLRKERLNAVGSTIECLMERAMRVVLAAQPAYAAGHAAWGNHLGARYHILWALPRQPDLLEKFFAEPGLAMMRPLLEEYAAASAIDPGFGERMDVIFHTPRKHSDRAWEMLLKTPAELHETGIYRLRLAGLLQEDGDYERSLPLLDQLRRQWPEDAAGYGNAIDALLSLGRSAEARAIMAEAPACYGRFALCHRQRALLEDQPPAPGQAKRPFLGRPDLAGLLLPDMPVGEAPSRTL